MRDYRRILRDDSRRLGISMMIMGEEEVDMVDMGMTEVGEEEVAVDMVGEVVVVVVVEDMEGEVVEEVGVVSGVIGDFKSLLLQRSFKHGAFRTGVGDSHGLWSKILCMYESACRIMKG